MAGRISPAAARWVHCLLISSFRSRTNHQRAGRRTFRPRIVRTQNTYIGIYVLDNFDITDRLSVHAGARFNDAIISLTDESGENPDLNGSHNFNRITQSSVRRLRSRRIFRSMRAIRKPTVPRRRSNSAAPARITLVRSTISSSPIRRCNRSSRALSKRAQGQQCNHWSWAPGRLDWSIAGYHTENQNDIYSVPSLVTGFGSFTNAGDTLREGVDVGATYTTARWDVYANYSYIQAKFLTPVLLSSPTIPSPMVTGNIQVESGDNLPGIPTNKFKFGHRLRGLPGWKVGGDVVYRSKPVLFWRRDQRACRKFLASQRSICGPRTKSTKTSRSLV